MTDTTPLAGLAIAAVLAWTVWGTLLWRAAPKAATSGCTCPSGDGSLRWPCPVHPPIAGADRA